MSEAQSSRPRSTGRVKRILVALGLVVAAGAAVFASRQLLDQDVRQSVASFPVQQGEFIISLELRDGELEAIKAEQVNAPRVRGSLKITHLFPEGEIVDVGDLIVEFEKAEFENELKEEEQELEAARGELEKTIANQKVEMARQLADIENRGAQMRLAQLQVEKMRFESQMDREEAKLKARQAELELEQAKTKLEAQKTVDGAERRNREIQVARQERDVERARKDLASLSIHAEKPGLVVYEKMRRGSRPEKIRVGDEPWGGATLITLPDLSRMQVETWVNEVDVDKLEVDQEVVVRLDALPGPVFTGRISKVASLGREKEGDKNVKVFDVFIEIEEQDTRLKPGMSATSQVIIQRIPQRDVPADDEITEPEEGAVASLPLYIPIDAVFEKDGRTLVYRMDGSNTVEQEVVLGPRNDNYVIIEEGLGASDRVALRDPTTTLDELGGMPDETADAGGSSSAASTVE